METVPCLPMLQKSPDNQYGTTVELIATVLRSVRLSLIEQERQLSYALDLLVDMKSSQQSGNWTDSNTVGKKT